MAIRLAAVAVVLIMIGPAATLIILTTMINSDPTGGCTSSTTGEAILNPPTSSPDAAAKDGETSRVVFPFPAGTWVVTDEFGPRTHPVTGEESFRTGLDLGAPAGTPILAAADGTVTVAEPTDIYGGLIIIQHRIDDETVATAYGHLWDPVQHVRVGGTVTAGQHLGDVGNAGKSTGPHLHFEVRRGGTNGDPWIRRDGCNPVGRPNWPSQAGSSRAAAKPTHPPVRSSQPLVTGIGWSMTPPATASSSPPALCTSTSDPERPSRTRLGLATRPGQEANQSIRRAAPATSPSATPSAPDQPQHNSRPAGPSPTG